MSKWAALIERHRAEHQLGRWDILPEAHWPLLAAQCGPEEIAEIKQRLADLGLAERSVPVWDGDAQDDIWRTRQMLTAILKLSRNASP